MSMPSVRASRRSDDGCQRAIENAKINSCIEELGTFHCDGGPMPLQHNMGVWSTRSGGNSSIRRI
jgi:hypothetical protein